MWPHSSLGMLLLLLPLLGLPGPAQPCWKRGGQPEAVRSISTVFRRNESGYDCFRIPGLVRTPQGALLVMSEGRKFCPRCEDYCGQHDLVAKRSTDGGHSFGELIRVVDVPKAFGAEFAGPKGGAVWDPTPVASTRSGAVFVWFSFSSSDRASMRGLRTTWMVSSNDDGRTWPTLRNMTSVLNAQHADPSLPLTQRWSWIQTGGGGGGIETSSGRLVVPGYHGQCNAEGWACSSCPVSGHGGACVAPTGGVAPQGDGWITYSHIWWSDDAGSSWNVSSGFGASTAEGSVVELFDEPAGQHLLSAGRMDISPVCMVDGKREACPDSFFMNCTLEGVGGGRRRDAAVPHCRRLSRSSDGKQSLRPKTTIGDSRRHSPFRARRGPIVDAMARRRGPPRPGV